MQGSDLGEAEIPIVCVYFDFPGLIGATCSLYVEFSFFNFCNAENPGKDLLHPSETTSTEEKRQSIDVPESKA